MANITAAGINNIEDINGCHINPEQSEYLMPNKDQHIDLL